jgi:hypothetical protein
MEEEKEEEGGEGEGGRVGGRTLLIMDQEREGRGWQLRPLLICLLAKFFSSNRSIPKKGHTGNTHEGSILAVPQISDFTRKSVSKLWEKI